MPVSRACDACDYSLTIRDEKHGARIENLIDRDDECPRCDDGKVSIGN